MPEQIKWTKTHCSRMDHGGCGLLVGAKDNRIVKIKGDPEGFLNQGYVCLKGLKSADRLTHPARLQYPLKRLGERGSGEWQRISWDVALEIMASRFLEIKKIHGARAVAFCQGMPKGLEHFALIRLANLFGSPNVVGTQDVCHAPREIAGISVCGFYPVADFHYPTPLAMLWGSNLTSTNEEGEICQLLLKRLKQGTALIVVDPRKTILAQKAKFWLPIKPGTDHVLARAFLQVILEEELFDRAFVAQWTHGFSGLAAQVQAYAPEKTSDITWLDPALVRAAARAYAEARPAALQWGNAIEQSRNCFTTARALVCLMALCGNLDVPGGNIQANEPPIVRLGQLVCADRLPDKATQMIHAHHGASPKMLTVPPAYFRKAVLESDPYPVRAAYFQCTNPLITYADSRLTYKALKALDFMVVSDIVLTPTALLADIVLPAATNYEFNDIGHCGLGHGFVLARPKVVDPPAECWPDIKILNELGKRITAAAEWHADDQGLLDEVLGPSGLSYPEFCERGFLKGPERFQKYLPNGFKTPSRKVELDLFNSAPRPERLDRPIQDPQYPLVLTSCKSRFYLHSSYRWVEGLRRQRPLPKVEIHPQTAALHHINQGDEVEISTPKGTIIQVAYLTDQMHPGVVNAAYGWWFPEEKPENLCAWERSNYNILTSAENLGKEFGTPDLKGLPCRIRRKDL